MLISAVLSGHDIKAQAVYGIRAPFNKSAYAGSEFHIMVFHELSKLDNKYVPIEIFKNEGALPSAANILYRLLRMGTYEFYISYVPVINQHEYFGHLARAKQFKAGFTRHEIYLFPPSGGMAYWGHHKYHPLTATERKEEYIGGMEANSIMAEGLVIKSLQNGSISFQESMLYLGSKSDFLSYVLFENNGSYDDIDNYLKLLNEERDQEQQICRKDLVLPAILTGLLDPFSVKSIYSLIVDYLIKGHNTFSAPALLRTGTTAITPYYSFEPGGGPPSHNIGGYISSGKQLYKINLHRAAFGKANDYGIQFCFYGSGQPERNLKFDLDLRYWHSETKEYHGDTGIIESGSPNGILLSGSLYQKLPLGSDSTYKLFIITNMAFKTGGYTKGYPLTEGMVLSMGLGYAFKN